jgi:pre-mRNA-splicing factor SYF1
VQVREIYETAIESEPPADLPEEDVRNLCVRYAQLERKLGEVDRARAIFVHGSHLADPRRARLAALSGSRVYKVLVCW